LRGPGKLNQISESLLEQRPDDSVVPVPTRLRSTGIPCVARDLAERDVKPALGHELARRIEHGHLCDPASETS
jgi:hypothetical protein